MRRLREECPNIRWVLTGSIGFHHVLREIGATTQSTNNTKVFALGPLSPEWAEWLAGCVLSGSNSEATDTQVHAELARATDGIPMLIHLVAELLRDEPRGSVSAGDIALLLDECFRRSDLSQNLTHLLTRLDDYYGNRTDEASELLDAASDGVTAGPTGRDGQTRKLVDLLVDDHYLVREPGGKLRWKYPSLARLWRIRRGLD